MLRLWAERALAVGLCLTLNGLPGSNSQISQAGEQGSEISVVYFQSASTVAEIEPILTVTALPVAVPVLATGTPSQPTATLFSQPVVTVTSEPRATSSNAVQTTLPTPVRLPVKNQLALLHSLPTAPIVQIPVATATIVVPLPPASSRSLLFSVLPPRMDEFATQLLQLHNAARANAGLSQLTLSLPLQRAAQLHAEDIARTGRGGHVGSDGSVLLVRLARQGFTGSYVGEDWAYAHTPAEAWKMWFTDEAPSGPHRDNILRAGFNHVGFGIASGGPFAGFGLVYMIADFSN